VTGSIAGEFLVSILGAITLLFEVSIVGGFVVPIIGAIELLVVPGSIVTSAVQVEW
jgi:hypothetical protein